MYWYCVSIGRVAHQVSTLPTPCQTLNQVSWSLDHKSAHAGTYEVRFFDEESYSLLRKVSIAWSPLEGPSETWQALPCCSFSPLGSSLTWSRMGWVGAFLCSYCTHPTCHFHLSLFCSSVYLPLHLNNPLSVP